MLHNFENLKKMEAFILQSNNSEDLKLLKSLIKKLDITLKPMYQEQMLDYGMGIAIKEGLKTKTVPKEKIIQKLKKNGSFNQREV